MLEPTTRHILERKQQDRLHRAEHSLTLHDRTWPITFEGDGAPDGDPNDYRYVAGVPICPYCGDPADDGDYSSGLNANVETLLPLRSRVRCGRCDELLGRLEDRR